MKKTQWIMASAFPLAIIATLAFRPAPEISSKTTLQTVYYQVTLPCDTQASCSNTGTITCVAGIPLNGYSDDQSACAGNSNFRFKP